MDDGIEERLTRCFQLVFPDLPDVEIRSASQEVDSAWDSLAAITLLLVVQEEFGIQMNLDHAAELRSFGGIRDYLQHRLTDSGESAV